MVEAVPGSGVSGRPRLIVLRGNSAAGKTSTAWRVRSLFGGKLAIISQDNIRINVLGEPDIRGGVNIAMIEAMARLGLARGYHVLLEGIFATERYGSMLRGLHRDHTDSSFFYLDVPWEETLTRHATREKSREFGAKEMREWYIPHDLLAGVGEIVIGPDSTLDDSAQLMLDTALAFT
ncbi:AAA family ATPase [Kitasatospora aureofaciens]|uniref:AAA family ATPase n=1 Tax=Kitasatospora aureofaciens TaxID=1894 RepID=UPI001C47A2A8|nr:AAA family ATPase [Kitasatospora aureofaciens]